MGMRALPLACILVLSARAEVSRADESPTAKAEKLFNEGNQLADRGDFAGACTRYDVSIRLDPAIGTQFNLADCNEHLGRLATALALFRSVESVARQAGRTEREHSARARAEALEKRVPRLAVTLKRESSVPGLEVACDDKALAAEDLGRPLPLDPGAHDLTARAPGRVAWRRRVDLEAGQSVEIAIPELVGVAALLPLATGASRETPRSKPWQAIGIAVGGAGVAGLAVGAIAGIVAIDRADALKSACGGGFSSCSKPVGTEDGALSTARGWASVSTVGFVAGATLLATGAAVYLWAPRAPEATTSIAVLPSAAGGGAGATLSAVW